MKRQLLILSFAASAIAGLSIMPSAHAQVIQEQDANTTSSFFNAMNLSATTQSRSVVGTLLGGRTGTTDHQDFYQFVIPVDKTLDLCYGSSASNAQMLVKSFNGRFAALGDIPRCGSGTKQVGAPASSGGGNVSFYAQFQLSSGQLQVPEQKSYTLVYKLQPTVK